MMVRSSLQNAHCPGCLLSLPRNYKTFRNPRGKCIIKYSATSAPHRLLTAEPRKHGAGRGPHAWPPAGGGAEGTVRACFPHPPPRAAARVLMVLGLPGQVREQVCAQSPRPSSFQQRAWPCGAGCGPSSGTSTRASRGSRSQPEQGGALKSKPASAPPSLKLCARAQAGAQARRRTGQPQAAPSRNWQNHMERKPG